MRKVTALPNPAHLCISLAGMSWFKGPWQISAGPGIALSGDGRLLQIERAQVSDTGSYHCVASNVVGNSELHYSLQVNGEWPSGQGGGSGLCLWCGALPSSCPSTQQAPWFVPLAPRDMPLRPWSQVSLETCQIVGGSM